MRGGRTVCINRNNKSHFYQRTVVEFANTKIFEGGSPFILNSLSRVVFYLSCFCIFIADQPRGLVVRASDY